MIVVRNIFRIQFGKSKEVTALWKQAMGIAQRLGFGQQGTRLLTDFAGLPFYTLVFETTHESLAQWEKASAAFRSDAQWQSVYQQISALTEEGRREILSVIE